MDVPLSQRACSLIPPKYILPNSEVHQHYTRQNSGVHMPRPTANMLKRYHLNEYRGVVLWNSLPEST